MSYRRITFEKAQRLLHDPNRVFTIQFRNGETGVFHVWDVTYVPYGGAFLVCPERWLRLSDIATIRPVK